MAAMCARFGLDPGEPPAVKRADQVLLSTEARDLMAPLHDDWRPRPEDVETLRATIVPWSPEDAEAMFRATFTRLWGAAHV